MNTANVENEPSIKEYPHIVIAEEAVLQVAKVTLWENKVDGEIHPEIGIVVKAIITYRERFPDAIPKETVRFLTDISKL